MTRSLAAAEAEVNRLAAGLRIAHSDKETLENRARLAELELRAERASSARFKVRREPLTYEPHGPYSFFYDMARARRMSNGDAKARLARHQREMDVELPKRAERRARAAAAYEDAFAADPAGQAALTRMTAAGISPFERETRAMTRTDGQGGYFDPPAWLLDQYVPYAREASPFASRWHTLDLPVHTDQVNVPRLALGAAVGPQAADVAPTGTRDIQDALVSASVRTVAGHADASRQWLDQGTGNGGYGVDQMLWADLTADLATNIDGQCLLGSGVNGQLLGVWPAGAIAAANGIVLADSNNTASQSWTVASSGAPLHTYAGYTASNLRNLRGVAGGWSDLAWFWHPWVWELYASQTDSQGRPLVLGQNLAALPAGAVGEYRNIPVFVDNNIPTSFGGTTAPYVDGITNGQYAFIAGTGAGNSYTPLLVARPDDLFLFAGAVKMMILDEVLSGSAQVRFQISQYLAAMPNRLVAGATVGSIVTAGGDVAHATLTWQQTNSLLIRGSGTY